MKRIFANLLISTLGRIVFPILLTVLSSGIAWVVAKIPLLAPVFEQISVYELAMGIMASLMILILHKINGATSEYIKPLQHWLNQRGHDIREDGWLYEKTAEALQRETGLPIREAVPVIQKTEEH